MSVAAVQRVADEGNTDPEETPETNTNKVAEGVATIYVSNAGDFKTFVEGEGCTDDYKKATRINIIGTGVTLSDEDLAAVAKFESLKLLDLSQVTVTDYSKIKNATVDYNTYKISLLVAPLANTTNEYGIITYADQVANVRAIAALETAGKFNSVFAVNKNESGVLDLFAMFNNSTNADLLGTVAAEKKPGNLVLINSTGEWKFGTIFTNSILPEVNKVTSAKCLVLSNLANCTQLDLTGITNSAFKRVILPDNYTGAQGSGWTLEKTEFGTGSDVKVVQYLKERWIDDQNKTNDFLTYVREAGGLAEINDCHYYQTNMSEAHSMIFSGNIKAEDISFLNGAKNNRVSLQALTHVDAEGKNVPLTETLKDFKNDYIEYMTLPDGAVEPVDYNFTETFANCKNLKGLGMAWTVTTAAEEEGGEATKSTGVAITSKARGAAYEVEQLLISFTHPETDQTAADGTENYCRLANADKVVFSGLIYAQDLIPRNANDFYTDADGHLCVKYDNNGALTLTNNNDNKPTYGVMHANKATTWDLSRVRLYDDSDNYTDEQKAAAQNDLCFTAYGFKPTNVCLPEDESVYRLPSSCFSNYGTITSICIPDNYTEIGSCAFQSHNSLKLVYTKYTEDGATKYRINGKTYTEEEYAAIDWTTINNSCTLPLNLERVETAAFSNCDKFEDVYVNYYLDESGEKQVPYCEKDAFDASSLYGFGGFHNTHPYGRDCYYLGEKSNTSYKAFSILHYPSGLPKSMAMKYTDLTRVYSYADETGATDGNGNIIVWPNQAEYDRAENLARSGYIWTDWTQYSFDAQGTATLLGATGTNVTTREDLLKDGAANEAATTVGLTTEKITGENAIYNTFAPKNSDTEGTSILESTNTWIGWHQFVLVAAVDYTTDKRKWTSPTNDDNWWTICLPFDMNASQIEENWGEGTLLCTLTGVERDQTKGTIVLKFGEDLVAKAKTANSSDAVLKNRMPYMIKPSLKGKEVGADYNGPTYTLTDEQTSQLDEQIKLVTDMNGQVLGSDKCKDCYVEVTATAPNSTEGLKDGDKDYNYVFVGSWTKYYIPTHAYFLGWDASANSGKGGVNYFYQKEAAKQAADYMNWNPYTCVIGHFAKEQAKWTVPTAEGSAHWTFTCNSGDGSNDVIDDSFPTAEESKVSMFFGADNTTAIGGIQDGSIKTVPAGTVYNLNGQVVATNGLANLAKGVYISNGKKFIVK